MDDANCWHNDSEQWQQMNSGKWLQGPKNDCIIIKEGLLWSEDDHTDGLRTSTNDDVVIDEACERIENFHICWTQKE